MKKISASTFLYKKLLPGLCFVFLLFVIVLESLNNGLFAQAPIFVLGPVFGLVLCFFIFKQLVWDLSDEVYDEGDSLLFRKGAQEQRVPLKDIVDISDTTTGSPSKIVIKVRTAGPLGSELAFIPQGRPMSLFSKSPIVADLIERVDQARNS